MSESNTESNFDTLPLDAKKLINQLLGNRELSFFASANKHYLNNVLTTLIKRYESKKLFLASGPTSMFCYNSEELFACGDNVSGGLGLGEAEKYNIFTKVPSIKGKIIQVSAGYAFTFVNTSEGLLASGYNSNNQLGLGHTNNCSSFTAVPIQGKVLPVENSQEKVIQVAAGGKHTLVLTELGLYVCGNALRGQLGRGDYEHCNFLTPVHLPGKVLQIAAGAWHSFVLTEEGLFACGENTYGPLGLGCFDNGVRNYRPTFERVNLLGDIKQIIGRSGHTYVLTSNDLFVSGSLKTIGEGYIKDGLLAPNFTRVNVPGNLLQIAAGNQHTVLLTDKGLYGYGSNQYGQLALEQKGDCWTFTEITKVPGNVLQIAANGDYTMFLTDHGLFGCGQNLCGQLGIGSYSQKSHDFIPLTRVENLPMEMKESIFLARLINTLQKMAEPKVNNEEKIEETVGFGTK